MQAVSLTKYVHDLASGRVITSRTQYDPFHQWTWISNAVAAWHDCDVDDVACVETDDGDRITVRGEIVAYVDEN